MCSRDKAEAFCFQCAMFICAECIKAHQILKVFTGHRIATLDNLKEGEAKDIMPEPTLQPCKVHKLEPLKIYCHDHKVLICPDCTIKKHRGCNYEPITEAAPEIKKILITKLDPLKGANAKLSQALKDIEENLSAIDKQEITVSESITTAFDELRHIIDTCEKGIKKEMKDKVVQKKKRLTNQNKSLSMARAVVQSVIEYTVHCVEHSADDEVMGMYNKIESRIEKEIEEQISDLEPVEDADIGVSVAFQDDLKELCQTKAKMILDYTVACEGLQGTEVDTETDFQVEVKLPNGKPVKKAQSVECHLKSLANDSVSKCEITPIEDGKYRIQYKPTVRGRHDLVFSVNGCEISTPPFRVFVSIPPSKMKNTVGVIERPVDIAITRSGECIIANNKIVKMAGGRIVKSYNRHADETFVGVTIDKTNSNVYATTYANSRNSLLKLTPDFTFIRDCEINDKNGISDLLGVAVVGDEVVVYDNNSKSLKTHNKDLDFIRSIPIPNNGTVYDVTSDDDGNFYVTDRSYGNVRVLSKTGDVLRSCSSNVYPLGLALFGEHIFVGNNSSNNIPVYTAANCQSVFTISGKGSGLDNVSSPRGMCMDEDGFLYVCDHSNNRIQVF